MLAAEQMFRKVGETKEAEASVKTEPDKKIERRLAISIHERSARFRMSKALWESIGRPARVDFTGTPTSGYQIRPGKKIKVQKSGSASVVMEIYPTQIGLVCENRSATQLNAFATDGFVQTDRVPWIEAPPAPPEPEKPTGVILRAEPSPEMLAQADEAANSELGAISLRNNSGGATLVFNIPKKMMARLDDPIRVTIIGNCAQGWTIKPVNDDREGVKVNYGLPGNSVYLTRGLAEQGVIGKEARKAYTVRLHFSDGVLKVGGPNYEWIRGNAFWLKKAEEPQHHSVGKQAGHMTTTADAPMTPTSGLAYQVPDTDDAKKLMADLGSCLVMAKAIMARFTEKTGVKLIVKRDLSVGVDLGIIPPSQQREIGQTKA